jgi:hypothetical protein
MSHMSEELRTVYEDLAARRRLPPLNVLTRLGFILADAEPANATDRERIIRYLCAKPERAHIAAQLETFHAVRLACQELKGSS